MPEREQRLGTPPLDRAFPGLAALVDDVAQARRRLDALEATVIRGLPDHADRLAELERRVTILERLAR